MGPDVQGQMPQTPFVCVHTRSIRGIVESRYYVSTERLDDRCGRAVGPRATEYLVAHGYSVDAVDTIIQAREATHTSYQFALQLAIQGMAFEEAVYLHGLMD
jgi:hypothetical protein